VDMLASIFFRFCRRGNSHTGSSLSLSMFRI